ncbi:hypothetical protein ACF0H5_001258 [Mactra antiquata]
MADKNINCSPEDRKNDEPDVKKRKIDSTRAGILLGYGNPLLDIQVVGTKEFLDKYELKDNNATLAEDKHKPMYDDMRATFKDLEYVPGGATLNSIKVAQWLLGTPKATAFFGCIKKDEYGKILEDKASEMGVDMKLQYTEKEPTGTCAVIVTGENRSLCAYLAAANLFTEDHLDDKDNWLAVENADFYYCAGFPLTVSPSTMLRLAKHSYDSGKTFCMNMSAPFLCQFFKAPMLELIPYVDVLLGNETEATTFSEQNDFGTSKISEIALKIADLPKEKKDKPRMVVITQGDQPVVVAYEGKIQEFPVIPIESKDIVDTNGAGDAFVGGFLSQYVQRKPLEECVRCGNYAANLVIQRSGCTVPDKPNFI